MHAPENPLTIASEYPDGAYYRDAHHQLPRISGLAPGTVSSGMPEVKYFNGLAIYVNTVINDYWSMDKLS